MGDHQLVPHPLRHHLIEKILISNPGGRIVGVTENEQAEAIPGTAGEGLQIGTPTVGLAEGEGLNVGVGQDQASPVGGVAGIQQQGCISGIQHGKRQVRRSLLRTDEQLNLAIRINGHAETAVAPCGDG